MIGLKLDDCCLQKEVKNHLEKAGYMVFIGIDKKMDLYIVQDLYTANLDLEKTILVTDIKDSLCAEECLYTLLKPVCISSLLDVIRQKHIKKREYDEKIIMILLDLGISPVSKGYIYLKDVIQIFLIHSDFMIKDIYELVGMYRETNRNNVERSIRYAIETGFNRCRVDSYEKIFGNSINPSKGKPTNMEFIARISDLVQTQ